MKYSIGVDIGGTKIASGIIDRNKNLIHIVEVPSIVVDEEAMYHQVLKSIEKLINYSNIPLQQIVGIGVGVPGKVNRGEGVAVFQNNIPWKDFPIVERLKSDLSFDHIVIDNDVYMAAYAEWDDTPRDSKETFVYLTISTGISCSIIHQKKFIRGDGFAGELGLFPIYSEESIKGMQRLEKIAAGPSIEQQAQVLLDDPEIKTKDFFQEYLVRNKDAEILMDSVSESLAYATYSIICLLDPQRIVFGGGVINHNPFLLKLIKEKLVSYLIPEQTHALKNLATSKLKGHAGVIGAALQVYKSIEENREVSIKEV